MRTWSTPPARAPLLLVPLILLASVAASAQPLVSVDDLLGTWRWENSYGGFAGDMIEPSADQWLQLEFAPAGKVRVSLSGAPVEGCCDRYIHRLAFDASGFVPIEQPSLGSIKARWNTGSP